MGPSPHGLPPQDAEDRVVEMVRLPYGYRIEEPQK